MQKVTILCTGKLKEKFYLDAAAEYAKRLGRFCKLDARCDALMKSAFERMGLTARSHDRVLRVARTIADLDGAEHIGVEHLSEAIQYRNTDILKG